MKKIAVLYGGTTSEREVSLDSGRNVAEALASTGRYDVKSVILDSDGIDALPDGVDAVYIALHGGWGEDGGVQAALDARGVEMAAARPDHIIRISSSGAYDRRQRSVSLVRKRFSSVARVETLPSPSRRTTLRR